MPSKNDIITDSNGEHIRFLGNISKKIYSKKTEKFIGVNLNNITMPDNFYMDDYKSLINKLQKNFTNLYKKKAKRDQLIIFAPKVINYQLDKENTYDIDSKVTFAVSIKTDKETTTFNAHSIKLYNSKETLNTDKVNSMKNGIVYNKEYIDVENLKLDNTKLENLLNVIFKRSDFNDVMKLQTLINSWISIHIQKTKKIEYEKECKKIEEKKEQELEVSKNSLQQAIQNIENVYKSCSSSI